MNSGRSNSLLLLAITITLVAMVAVHFFPERRLVLAPVAERYFYLDAAKLPDGTMTSEWIDQAARSWRCNVPEHAAGNYFNCGIGLDLALAPGRGVNLARFSHMTMTLYYTGKTNKVRISVRQFDPAFTKVEDANSGKFTSMQIHASELNKPLRLDLHDFRVADWWVSQYNIPLAQSRTDLSNIISFNIDFGDQIPPGVHELRLEKLEFSGEWISAEHWYLMILAAWMLGIFGFTLKSIFELRAKAERDIKTINQLHSNNAELRTESDKFRRLSTVDPLTQTFNRFGIDKIVATLMAVSHDRFTDAPNFALIMVDIDHFKRINDRRGHDAGDRVLQQVSSILQSSIRPVDFLGRWGGEEFLVIMPNTHVDTALAMAERIRMAISSAAFEPEQPLAVTASFGVSDQLPAEDFATTFKRADIALYSAKAQGRNCVVKADRSLGEGPNPD